MKRLFYNLMMFLLFSGTVQAQTVQELIQQPGDSVSSQIIRSIILLTALSLLPALLIMATSFTRFIIAFSFLRSGLGLQSTPATIILVTLSLFLTYFVMAPTLEKSWTTGISPLLEKQISEEEAFTRIVEPFRSFMLSNVREKDLQTFQAMAQQLPQAAETSDVELRILIPAFMISELRRGFEIGFLIILPFLIIDLVVATLTMSMGMMMLPPTVISLPFKVLFFILIDGWSLLAASLVRSFGAG